jgi:hypothetical protein
MVGWGALFMTITTVLFWVLIILGVIALFRVGGPLTASSAEADLSTRPRFC